MDLPETWSEKLNTSVGPEVQPIPSHRKNAKPGSRMLIPSAKLINDYISAIPFGTSVDPGTMRRELAREYEVEFTCPVTTSLHLRIVAEAAFEALNQGAAVETVTPFWRMLDKKTPAIRKLTFDPQFIAERRAAEGI